MFTVLFGRSVSPAIGLVVTSATCISTTRDSGNEKHSEQFICALCGPLHLKVNVSCLHGYSLGLNGDFHSVLCSI